MKAFKPRDVYPCTVDQSTWSEAISMKTLFGDLCSADIFAHDRVMYAMKGKLTLNDNTELDDQPSSEPATPLKRRASLTRHVSEASAVSSTLTKRVRKGSPADDDARQRARRRASIAKGVMDGTPWRPLQSVSGYYREGPEKEL